MLAPFTRRGLLQGSAGAFFQRSGYAAWSWERWREITGEAKPELTTFQSGRAQLSPLWPDGGAWRERRGEIRKVVEVFTGQPPASAPPLDARVEEEVTLEGGIVRRRVRYQSEPGEFIPAFVFQPPGDGPMPAVLCPHQTTQAGKKEPAGIEGNPRLAMALALAKRGYVTLSYDAACFGERHDPDSGHYGDAIPFYRKHPRWSMMGKMAWDLSRGVSYLREQKFVRADRIGSIGHSHGAYTTWFGMALDDRIAAGVASCGFDTFRHDGNPYRWSHATALLPRLGFYVSSPHISIKNYSGVPDSAAITIPFDMHWVLALIAPRPLLLTASDDDNIFPNSGWSTRQAELRLKPVYEGMAAAGKIESFYFRGGHGFPVESEARAFAFLDRWLR